MKGFLLLLLLNYSVFAVLPSLQLYNELSQANLKRILNNSDHDFEQLYNELYIQTQTNQQLDQDEVMFKNLFYQKICNTLKNFDFEDQSIKQQYYYTKSFKLLENCQVPQFERLSNVASPDDFLDFYFTLGLDLQFGQTDLCSTLSAFIGTEGAGKTKKFKNSEDNYKLGSMIYELAFECFEQQQNESQKTQLINTIKKPLQTAIINIQTLFTGTAGLAEKDQSVRATARLIGAFYKFLPHLGSLNSAVKKEFQNRIFQESVINLIRASLQVSLSSGDRAEVLKLLKNPELSTVTIPYLNKNILSPSKVVPIYTKFVNIFSERVQNPTNLSASLYKDSELIQSGISLTTSSNKNKEYQGQFEISSDKFKNPGQYQLLIEVTSGEFTYTFTETVQLGSKIRVKNLNFDMVQGKDSQPQFENSLQEKEFHPEVQKADEHSYLHVIFSLQQDNNVNFQPKQVGVRLVHPRYFLATSFVQAQYDSKEHSYYAIIDFGNQDHILPHNGQYKVELIVADSKLSDNVRWIFANIDVTFTDASERAPLTDGDYIKPNQIIHQFQPPREEIPLTFVSFFLITIVLAFVFYITTLLRIGVNTNKIPQDSTAYLVYLFFILLIGVFVVLFLFWVAYNLIETITLLSIVFIPLFLVGNFALLKLKDDKQD